MLKCDERHYSKRTGHVVNTDMCYLKWLMIIRQREVTHKIILLLVALLPIRMYLNVFAVYMNGVSLIGKIAVRCSHALKKSCIKTLKNH